MREALSILASSAVVHPSASPLCPWRRRINRESSTEARIDNRTQPNINMLAMSSTFIASPPWDRQNIYNFQSELPSKLLEEGKIKDFLMIAEAAVSSGLKPSEFIELVDSDDVAAGIAKFSLEGDLINSLENLLDGLKQLGVAPVHLLDGPAVEALRVWCCQLLKCGEVEQILNSLDTLSGYQIPIDKLVDPAEFIGICVIKRYPTAAIRFAHNFKHAEMLACSIILEFGKRRDLISALTAFEEYQQRWNSPSLFACRTIIDVCGLCGNYLKSRTIFEELLARNVTPNTYVLNSLMNVNAHDLNYVMHIYKKMDELGVSADIISYNILLKSCSLSGKVESAQSIYEEIKKLESVGALKLDTYTYSTMVKVYADARMWKLALQIKDEMEASSVLPNAFTWSSLIDSCAKAGLIEQAIKLFDEMLRVGIAPNSKCFNIILHACVESSQFDRAFRLFQCWKERGFQVSVTDENRKNISMLMSEDDRRVSSGPLSSSTINIPFSPTTSTYNVLMKACGTDYHRAKVLMEEMKNVGLSPDHISWSILIDICGCLGNVIAATQILTSMRESGTEPDVIAYTTAIKICVKHKNPRLAFLLFGEMKKYQIKPNAVTYRTILRARSRYGSLDEVQQCLAVYQDMRKAGYKPNDYYLKQLIEEWCEGVIENECLTKRGRIDSHKTNFGPQSVLLEKVAEHLKGNNGENACIDIRDLTKVEARIVVLAVLRKMKEKYATGSSSVKDDVFIITGVQEFCGEVCKDDNGVSEAVIRLLQQDLGLHVFGAGKDGNREKLNPIAASRWQLKEAVVEGESKYLTRRPVVLHRLKVTKESLNYWLQRKIRSSQ